MADIKREKVTVEHFLLKNKHGNGNAGGGAPVGEYECSVGIRGKNRIGLNASKKQNFDQSKTIFILNGIKEKKATKRDVLHSSL